MHFADYKTILSPNNGMNLYRGCSHGCIYCDSRSHCYQMQHDFEDIEVKRDAPRILDDQLSRRKKPCMISTGGMSDSYIPLEKDLQMTRQCLKVIYEYACGVTILTKSALVLRDLDLLQAINRRSKAVVQMTLTTYDEGLCRKLEPSVSSSLERFRALEVLRDAALPTLVWLGPILPFINDSEENLQGILDCCFKAKVRGILCFGFGLTLREGNREYFYQALDKNFPALKERYIRTFADRYVCNSPKHASLMKIFRERCEAQGVLYTPERIFGYLSEYEAKRHQVSFFD